MVSGLLPVGPRIVSLHSGLLQGTGMVVVDCRNLQGCFCAGQNSSAAVVLAEAVGLAVLIVGLAAIGLAVFGAMLMTLRVAFID